MKFFGLCWLGFNLAGTAFIIFFLFPNIMMINEYPTKIKFLFYFLAVLSFLIFFNIIIIDNSRIIILRPLWFLYKKNTFKVSEINQIDFTKAYHATTSSTNMKFIDKEGLIILNTTIYWFKFEEKQLINKLKEFGVKVDCDFD